MSSLDNVILSVPDPPDPSPPQAVCDPLTANPRASSSDSLPYNLRPRANRAGKGLVVGGLASDPAAHGPRKMRGRKSNLSKAQLKVVVDIADERQMSLTGVLRAERPPPEGVP